MSTYNFINRDKPALYEYEFDEGEEHWDLEDFFDTDNDYYAFHENDTMKFVFDFNDPCIMAQTKDTERKTFIINLLYAKQHFPKLYTMWWKIREQIKLPRIKKNE